MPLCSKTATRSCARSGLVAVAVAGGEQRHLAAWCRRRRCPRQSAADAGLLESRRSAVRSGTSAAGASRMHAERLLEQLARPRVAVGGVDDLGDHRNAGEAARPRRCELSISSRNLTLALLALAPPWRAASGAESPRSRDAAARTGTWSCSTCRTGSSGRPPASSRACPRRRARRVGDASIRSNRVGNDWHRLKQRRQPWQMSKTRSQLLDRARPRRRTAGCASRADGASAPRGCLRARRHPPPSSRRVRSVRRGGL